MVRSFSPGLAALLLLGAAARTEAPRGAPPFSLSVPLEMVTGKLVVRAQAVDENVTAVKWIVDDWARVTPPPFELTFDAGPVPYERRVVAVALDKDRRPLYRQEAAINPGGRGLQLEFRSPVDGQTASGPLRVELHARTPADDELGALVLDAGGAPVPLTPVEPGVFLGTVEVSPAATALVARLQTRRGRQAERTILVNARGVSAESDVHVVEQLVGVTRGGRPLEDLTREDFTVRDERGVCEVRDAQLVRDAPLAVGLALDTSVSLRHTQELRLATANEFLERFLTEKDTAFLLGIGPAAVRVLDWTSSKEMLKKGVLSLSDSSVAGTPLYEGIQKALYEFQGQQGARALLLVTDGYDFDGDVSEESVLTYARQSGVKIFALGLTSSYEMVTERTRRDPDGEVRVVETKRQTMVQPTNVEVLSRFADATGGKTYLLTRVKDLPKIYREIERDIRTQYLVSYVSTARRRNAFHPVEVRTSRGKVLTAPGFFY